MNISNQNQKITFGQLVPTEPLLKAAIKMHKFEDAKVLNNAIGINYSGHISFYQRAITIADGIIKKNPEVAEIVSALQKITDSQAKIKEIWIIQQYHGH
jgi:hypothetical protein